MLSFIKTALVTIIISFISGVLLDYYRNYAPRIICSMGRNKVIRKNGKKDKVYSLTIRNISKKTIHDLNVNITANCDSLKLHNTKITNGLRFNIADENNMFNITIPFLSSNDELMTKIILEGNEENKEKPVINLKSPENFKQIDSYNNKPQENNHRIIDDISSFFEKVFYNNRKIILGIVALAVLVFMGILAGEYYSNTINNDNKLYQKAGSEGATPSSNSTDEPIIDAGSDSEDSAVDSENYGNEMQRQTGEEESTSNYPGTTYNEDNGYNNSTNATGQESLNSYGSQGEGTTTDTTTNNEGTSTTGENIDSSDTTATTGTSEDNGTTEGNTSDGGTTEDQGGENGDTTSSGGTDTTGTTGDAGTTSTSNEINQTYNLLIN